MIDCYALNGLAVIDCGTGAFNQQIILADYQNQITLMNYNVGGTDTMSVSGSGRFIIDASCAGGTINIRGMWEVIDNAGGAVTIVYDDNTDNINTLLGTGGGTDWTASERDEIRGRLGVTGTIAAGGNTPTLALDATLTSRTPTAAQLLYMTRHAATAVPVTFSGGSTTTAILVNVDGVAASSTNDVYNSRLFVFNTGTLDKQVCQITGYDGATKTATITAVTTAVTAAHTAVLV